MKKWDIQTQEKMGSGNKSGLNNHASKYLAKQADKIVAKLSLIIVFMAGMVQADCIKPIRSGENLWKLVARIGACIDDTLEETNSKLDALACVNPGCEVEISQADIPYVITQPGIYCLSESVTNTGLNSSLITVSASNVVLDLKDHVMDGGTQDGFAQGAQDGILIYPGFKNIVIKNGTISNCAAHGINASSTIQPDIQTPIERLTIENIQVMDLSEYLPALSNMDQLDVIGSTLDSLSAVSGFDPVLECCLGNEFERVRKAVGLYIDGAYQVTITNCRSCGVQGDGIYLRYVQAAVVNNCDSSSNGGNGFVFDNCDVSSVSCCKAEQNGFNGFYEVSCNGDNGYTNCTAKQNGVHGFRIIGGGKIIDSCIANQNTLDGFFVVTPQNSTVDGSLDITFGTDGKVTTDFSGAGSSDAAYAVVLQKDGGIVVAGDSDALGSTDFALAFYRTDGVLTNTVTTDFGGSDSARGVAIQEDGKIVAAGFSTTINSDFALARYNPDGSLNTSFGILGKVTTDFSGTGTSSDQAFAVAIQKDGKIVAAGVSNNSGTNDFALARYNIDGSLDGSFGVGGKVETDFGGTDDQAYALALQEDGKIVAVGKVGNDFALARYNTDGSLDMSFGVNGKVITSFSGGADQANAVAIQKNGKIVVAGASDLTGLAEFALARYNSDGSLDIMATTDFSGNNTSFDVGNAVVIQKDGKIVISGSTTIDNDFALARYTTDGSLDAASFDPFGTLAVVPGTVITDFGDIDISNALALQQDGKILAIGTTTASGSNDIALARYNIFKRGSVIHDSVAQENGRHGFNITEAAKITLFNNVSSNNACDGYLGAPAALSAFDMITKNIGDNNNCADYSNIDSVLLSPSAGAWKNIRLS